MWCTQTKLLNETRHFTKRFIRVPIGFRGLVTFRYVLKPSFRSLTRQFSSDNFLDIYGTNSRSTSVFIHWRHKIFWGIFQSQFQLSVEAPNKQFPVMLLLKLRSQSLLYFINDQSAVSSQANTLPCSVDCEGFFSLKWKFNYSNNGV